MAAKRQERFGDIHDHGRRGASLPPKGCTVGCPEMVGTVADCNEAYFRPLRAQSPPSKSLSDQSLDHVCSLGKWKRGHKLFRFDPRRFKLRRTDGRLVLPTAKIGLHGNGTLKVFHFHLVVLVAMLSFLPQITQCSETQSRKEIYQKDDRPYNDGRTQPEVAPNYFQPGTLGRGLKIETRHNAKKSKNQAGDKTNESEERFINPPMTNHPTKDLDIIQRSGETNMDDDLPPKIQESPDVLKETGKSPLKVRGYSAPFYNNSIGSKAERGRGLRKHHDVFLTRGSPRAPGRPSNSGTDHAASVPVFRSKNEAAESTAIPPNDKPVIYIAGLFPRALDIPAGSVGRGVLPAVNIALDHVNNDTSRKYYLKMASNDTRVSNFSLSHLCSHQHGGYIAL